MELILDGMVGPTHHYGGLSRGNIASMAHQNTPSSPKQAALEGLHKMKQVANLGVKQAVLPPQRRPHFDKLRELGFSGSDEELIKQVATLSPLLLQECSSASSMWAANIATVTPSFDTADRSLHLSLSNLGTHFHRFIEPPAHERILKHLFAKVDDCIIHPPIPYGGNFGDEGANHIRFGEAEETGVHLFVHGVSCFSTDQTKPLKFAPRQSKEAQEVICRRHQLREKQVVFAKQNDMAIEAGVFHNDVISLGLRNLFIYHEKAFEKREKVLEELKQKVQSVCGVALIAIQVSEKKLSLDDSVCTYLFNSELISLANQNMALIAPIECNKNVRTKALIQRWLEDKHVPITEVYYSPLRQSMQNGGGPACLSLRVPLTEKQFAKINPHFLLTDELFTTLVKWVRTHYRDTLYVEDLADPVLSRETKKAFEELQAIFHFSGL